MPRNIFLPFKTAMRLISNFFFELKNGTLQEEFVVSSGQGNIKNVGRIETWNNLK